MHVNLIAIGDNMPSWVMQGFIEYQKRLSSDYRLNLIEVAAPKRSKTVSIAQLIELEGQRLLARIPQGNYIICLDQKGQSYSSEQLATKLRAWHDQSQDISLLVGGPDGLSEVCKEKANGLWSLSSLTLPHPLVRIIVAEQLYRAFSIISHHPYHR